MSSPYEQLQELLIKTSRMGTDWALNTKSTDNVRIYNLTDTTIVILTIAPESGTWQLKRYCPDTGNTYHFSSGTHLSETKTESDPCKDWLEGWDEY